jgi:hypothetical protein
MCQSKPFEMSDPEFRRAITLSRPEVSAMKRRSEAGQAIAAVAVGLLVLIGIVGLAIDMGYMRFEKRRMQSAADSAAIAAASELQYYPSDDIKIKMAAWDDSKANGFENDVNGAVVVPSSPPLDAPFAGGSNYVEVKVQQNVPTFFMRIFGVNSTSLSVTAVAELGSSRGCIYALDPASLGITVNATVTAPNCGIVNNAALSIGGGCINAASIGVLQPFGGGCATPAPVSGIAQANDPLAYLTVPAAPSCTQPALVTINSAIPTTLPPCIYSGGIRVAPTNTGAVTFQPGVHYLSGIGLQSSGPSDLSGNGVTLFVCDALSGLGACSALGPAPSVQIANTGTVTLSAPVDGSTGGIPGILFFQHRLDAASATISGGNVFLTGALYFPGALLTLGANQQTPYMILVAQSILFQGATIFGNPTTGNNYSSLSTGSPIKAATLVQ